MERCVLGATQNQNKSFNGTVWNYLPKTDFYSAEVVGTAVDLAVVNFNGGQGALLSLFEQLNYHCGPTTKTFFRKKDDRRIWMADYKGRELVMKRRRQMRLDRVMTEEEQAAKEGTPY